ncbi:hypothetical protein PQR15_22275 [Streptomyces lydicus]|nr:hypothetical protein [Streptomyces lydicus]
MARGYGGHRAPGRAEGRRERGEGEQQAQCRRVLVEEAEAGAPAGSPAAAAARASAARSWGRLPATVTPAIRAWWSRRTPARSPRHRRSPSAAVSRKALPGGAGAAADAVEVAGPRQQPGQRAGVAGVVPSSSARRGPASAATASSGDQCPVIQGRPEGWRRVRRDGLAGRQRPSASEAG